MIDLAAIERREAEVLGDGPRIEPLDPESCRDDVLAFADRVMRADSARLAVIELADFPEYVPTMLHHPGLFERHTAVGLYLLSEGTLSPREREFAVLRIAWLCQAPYEWGEHVFIAQRGGISSDEIERITVGSTAAGWSALDRAILAGVEELHAKAAISDATWAVLAQHWDKQQLIEFPLLVGVYQSTAYLQNALRMRLHTGNTGLRAR
jgi:alkylhydroperoxidase family enzyme